MTLHFSVGIVVWPTQPHVAVFTFPVKNKSKCLLGFFIFTRDPCGQLRLRRAPCGETHPNPFRGMELLISQLTRFRLDYLHGVKHRSALVGYNYLTTQNT